MNVSWRRGTAVESPVVGGYAVTSGLTPSGGRCAVGPDAGDIAGLSGVVVDVKDCKEIDLASWLDELAAEVSNAGAEVGALSCAGAPRVAPTHAFTDSGDDCPAAAPCRLRARSAVDQTNSSTLSAVDARSRPIRSCNARRIARSTSAAYPPTSRPVVMHARHDHGSAE